MTTTLDPETYSIPGNARAAVFAQFAAPHLRGRLLDVGCGAAPVPLYLALHPLELITGLDPEPAEHPFSFHLGHAEQMPFPSGSFDTVVCATALDHLPHASYVSDALKEIRRVLRPGGRFISWETTLPLGQAQDGDEHHRFRFTDDWLFSRFCDFFAPVAIEWRREGMRYGCAEVFSVWETSK